MAILRATADGAGLPSEPLLAADARRDVVRTVVRGGDLLTPEFVRALDRLAMAFTTLCAYYPFGCWRQGLVVTAEMHRLVEQYLPLAEVWRAWRGVVTASIAPPVSMFPGEGAAASWLAILERLDLAVPMAPHLLLGRMLRDEEFREKVLFAWYLPRHHGGGFNRYPAQLVWLRQWLGQRRARGVRDIKCLDAACGSGEGTYELAALLAEVGFYPHATVVRGSTLQPLEVVAAALAHFPHDPEREQEYRQQLTTLLPRAATAQVTFRPEDLRQPVADPDHYDLILCNGLLGGPLLHDRLELQQVLRGLVARLRVGGILLADDRFHAGWHRAVPRAELAGMLVNSGLRLLPLASGVGGELPGQE